jgi:hypothetical protein
MAIHDATHPRFDDHERSWLLVRRMLTGENIERELVQRYFEHDRHFEQREEDADHTPRLRFLLGRLVGMLFQREDEVERRLGPLDQESLEGAGPEGEDYRVQLMELAQTLLAYNEAIVIVNPRKGLQIESPLAVPHFTSMEAVVKGSRTTSASVFEDAQSVDTWTRYTPIGWETYRKPRDEEEGEQVLVESGQYVETGEDQDQPFFVDSDERPRAPVMRIKMPWGSKVGLQLARKARAIFRLESRRDFSLSTAMNGIIQLGVGSDSDLADRIKKGAKRGDHLWPYDKDLGEHKGLQLPTDGAELGTEVISDKEEALHRVAYNELQQAARTAQSATEAQIQRSGGAAAALSVLAATLSDAERRILKVWSQAEDFTVAGPNPRLPDVGAEWPEDFSEVDLSGTEQTA